VPDSVPAAARSPDSLSPPASSGPTPVAGTIVDRIVDDAPSGLLNVFAGIGEQRDDPSVLVSGVPSIPSAIASDGNGLLHVGVGDARLCALRSGRGSAAVTGASGIEFRELHADGGSCAGRARLKSV
jgi:hypothetical protein